MHMHPARLATLPYGFDPNVTQLVANLLTKPSVFYYLPIVPCNLVLINLLLLLLINILRANPFRNPELCVCITAYQYLACKSIS